MSIDPQFPSSEVDHQIILNIKKAIIRALRNTFDNIHYPDEKIQGINISYEYPLNAVEYPTIWVEWNFDSLQTSGLGHSTFFNTAGDLVQKWFFTGHARLTVMSLSSYERDIYSSQLLQMLAFGPMNPIAAIFYEFLSSADSNVALAINRDRLQVGGQQSQVGTPWDPEQLAYTDVYSFEVFGEMDSHFYVAPTILTGIHVHGELADDPDRQINLDEDFGTVPEDLTWGAWQ